MENIFHLHNHHFSNTNLNTNKANVEYLNIKYYYTDFQQSHYKISKNFYVSVFRKWPPFLQNWFYLNTPQRAFNSLWTSVIVDRLVGETKSSNIFAKFIFDVDGTHGWMTLFSGLHLLSPGPLRNSTAFDINNVAKFNFHFTNRTFLMRSGNSNNIHIFGPFFYTRFLPSCQLTILFVRNKLFMFVWICIWPLMWACLLNFCVLEKIVCWLMSSAGTKCDKPKSNKN